TAWSGDLVELRLLDRVCCGNDDRLAVELVLHRDDDLRGVELVLRLAGDRLLELAHPLAEAAAHFRQSLRAEQDEREQTEQEQFGKSDEYRQMEPPFRWCWWAGAAARAAAPACGTERRAQPTMKPVPL